MSEVEDFFKGRAEEFRLGELKIMSDRIAFPLAIYTNGEVTIYRTPCQVEAMLRGWRDRLLSDGYVHTSVEIIGIEQVSADRARIEVIWAHKNAEGKTIQWCELVYFLTKSTDGAWRISMLELVAQNDPARILA